MGAPSLPDRGRDLGPARVAGGELTNIAGCGGSDLLLSSRDAQPGCGGVVAVSGNRKGKIPGRRDRAMVGGDRSKSSAVLDCIATAGRGHAALVQGIGRRSRKRKTR